MQYIDAFHYMILKKKNHLIKFLLKEYTEKSVIPHIKLTFANRFKTI